MNLQLILEIIKYYLLKCLILNELLAQLLWWIEDEYFFGLAKGNYPYSTIISLFEANYIQKYITYCLSNSLIAIFRKSHTSCNLAKSHNNRLIFLIDILLIFYRINNLPHLIKQGINQFIGKIIWTD